MAVHHIHYEASTIVWKDPAAVAAGVARINREPRLHEELNRYVSWLNEKVGSLKDQREQTEKLRQALIEAS